MMDQVNFEATRPVSADPAVALAEMLGQLPKPVEKPKPVVAKTSVEDLAGELGLKLGEQNELTIRRIKRGKGYSFIRANGSQIRHAGTIRRLHRMAMPPAYREVRYSPDPDSHLQAVGVDAAGPAAIPLSRGLGKGARAAQGASAGKTGRRAPKNPPQCFRAPVGRGADARIRAVGRDRTDRAHRDPPRQ